MTKLKKIGVLSLAIFQAIFLGSMGLISGILIIIREAILPFKMSFGILYLILMIIGYTILGFIGGAIGALIYNLIAKYIGGIEMEFEQ